MSNPHFVQGVNWKPSLKNYVFSHNVTWYGRNVFYKLSAEYIQSPFCTRCKLKAVLEKIYILPIMSLGMEEMFFYKLCAGYVQSPFCTRCKSKAVLEKIYILRIMSLGMEEMFFTNYLPNMSNSHFVPGENRTPPLKKYIFTP